MTASSFNSALHGHHLHGALIVLALLVVPAGCRKPIATPAHSPESGSAVAERRTTLESTTGRSTKNRSEKAEPTADAPSPAATLESIGYSADKQMKAAMATVRVINSKDVTEGSGVIIARNDQGLYVLTAAHIVNGAHTVDMQLFSTATYPKPARNLHDATVLADSPHRDLALLRADAVAIKTPYLAICPLDQVPKRSGFWVMTLGCGNGKPPAPLLDWIVASPRIRRPDTDRPLRVWELRQRQSPGRSGGPMLDRELRVLGIGSGTSGRHGYYCHITEIHAFLQESGLSRLLSATAKRP